MEYFVNKEKGLIVGFEDGEVVLFEKVNAGGGQSLKKNRGGRPKKEEEKEQEKTGKKRQRMTPEIINKVKMMITKGESPAIIAEEFGINVASVYQLKSKMKATKTSDDFTGKGEE